MISPTVRGFRRRFRARESPILDPQLKEKTPDRWGERPGVGVLLRGAGGNSFCLVHLLYGQPADLPQLFISEIRLFLLARHFLVSESRSPQDPPQFPFPQPYPHTPATPI